MIVYIVTNYFLSVMPLRRKPRQCGITRSEQPQFSRQQKLMMTIYNVYHHKKKCALLAKGVENIHDRCPCGVSF